MHVSLHLLGQPYAELAGQRRELPLTQPIRLLLYLAVRGDWVSREELAALFRPHADEATARGGVRLLLARARRWLGAQGLEVEPTRLRWVAPTDVSVFRRAVARKNWAEAVARYRGPLLEGLPTTRLTGFDGWLELERHKLQAAWQQAATHYARDLCARGGPERALELLQRVLAADPLAEDVLQLLLETCARAGRRSEALRRYGAFAAQLTDELGLEPLERTAQLAEAIRRGNLPATADPPRAAPAELTYLVAPAPLRGRHTELQAVAAAPRGLLLAGELGIGKSRLLAEALPGACWLACREGLEHVPYHPVLEALRGFIRLLPDLGGYRGELTRLLPDREAGAGPPVPPTDPQEAKVRRLEALARAFEIRARPVVIDDLQWADAATLEWLVYLAVRQQVPLYGTYRIQEVRPEVRRALAAARSGGGLAYLELSPLQPDDLQDLLTDLLGEALPDLSRRLFKASGGNPFFALETVKTLLARGPLYQLGEPHHLSDLRRDGDADALEVPASVAELVRRRTEGLSEPAQRVLAVASVLNSPLNAARLEGTVGLSGWALSQALGELEQDGLVREGRFAHDLTRGAVYQQLPPARRTFLHAQAARALAGSADPLIVAEHHVLADQPERAAQLWFQTARERYAKEPGFEDQATALYERVLALELETPETFRARAYLAGRYLSTDRGAEAERLIDEVLTRSDDALARAFALLQRTLLHYLGGRLEAAQHAAQAAAWAAEPLDDAALQDDVLLAQAIVLHARGDYLAALSLVEPIVARKRRQPPNSGLSNWLNKLAADLCALGRYEEALALYHEQLELARTLGLKRQQVLASSDIISTYHDLGRIEAGLAVAEEALELGDFDVTYPLRYHLALAYVKLGVAERALEQLMRVLEGGSVNLRAHAYALLAELYLSLGRAPDGLAALDQGLSLAEGTDIVTARAVMSLAVLRFGTPAQRQRVEPILKSLEEEALPAYLKADYEAALRSQAQTVGEGETLVIRPFR